MTELEVLFRIRQAYKCDNLEAHKILKDYANWGLKPRVVDGERVYKWDL